MKYLANAFSLNMLPSTIDNVSIKIEKVSLEEARRILKDEIFISAVGHAGTADILSNLLNKKVTFNRIEVSLKDSSDIIIIFQLKGRLPEGAVLSQSEIEKLEYTFYKISLI